MGFSDAEICLSDQKNLCETDLGFLYVPSIGFSDRNVQELRPDQDLETKFQEKIKCSRDGGVKVNKEEEEEDFCKTPTRLDQILPAVPNICPPAPRKPKGVPSRSLKVRNSYRSRRMIILNVSREIDYFFFSDLQRRRRISAPTRSYQRTTEANVVYKGQLQNLGFIAVKKLKAPAWADPDIFAEDARRVGGLKHKRVINLLGYCCDREERLLVSEFMPNDTFAKRLFHRKDSSSSFTSSLITLVESENRDAAL
ncbi:unnamed protein product [Microthlaspi erraticum]|uniref:Serine/threonine-protein kinase BSK n=1 Tax=Microthlaspi erraticum TaxID=1685480 RepID=A0A6D2HSQ4_9BRAS|nr:unnamed protein product [Microthlaspi erraticum]